ncbi:MAG: four helix bundle protein [Candidatus Doudnabacteria bacterium]|jgi:four helix bundle protein
MEANKVQSYRDLIVWQKAMDLVVLVYQLTDKYPKSEIYGLVSQSRRCAVSIPSNIAEGRLRGTRKDFRQFLIIAFASGAELETQLEIARRLKYILETDYSKATMLLTEVMKMLNAMIINLNS